MSEKKELGFAGKIFFAMVVSVLTSAMWFFVDFVVTEPEFTPVRDTTQELSAIVKQNSIAIQQQTEYNNYSSIRNATRDIALLENKPENELSAVDKIRLDAAKEQLRTRGIEP